MREAYDTETGMVTISDGEHEASLRVTDYQDRLKMLEAEPAYRQAAARLLTEYVIRWLLDLHAEGEVE